jgi:hypothetical protein
MCDASFDVPSMLAEKCRHNLTIHCSVEKLAGLSGQTLYQGITPTGVAQDRAIDKSR